MNKFENIWYYGIVSNFIRSMESDYMFPRKISEDSLTTNGAEAIKIRKFMTFIAWTFLIIGMILSLVSLGNYSDKNHVLMVGIGFLIASVNTYIIGLCMALMFKAPQENAQSDLLKPDGSN